MCGKHAHESWVNLLFCDATKMIRLHECIDCNHCEIRHVEHGKNEQIAFVEKCTLLARFVTVSFD